VRRVTGVAILAFGVSIAVAASHASSAWSRLPERITASAPGSAVAPTHASVPAATATPREGTYLILHPRDGQELVPRASPGGDIVARLGERTEFGSPQTVAVVRCRGRWFGVVTTHLPNGRLGWIDRDQIGGVRYTRTHLNLVLDLSARRLVFRSGTSVIRRMRVGVGAPASPTPIGRFAITDKLSGPAFSSYYGCCILALSAHQPNLPADWSGDDRIAIHGTYDVGSIGAASTAGCVRAAAADLHVLMRRVPLGTPVLVHA
jgi:lipoprotein-anchoring transpeptidase ErfK/SrfK